MTTILTLTSDVTFLMMCYIMQRVGADERIMMMMMIIVGRKYSSCIADHAILL